MSELPWLCGLVKHNVAAKHGSSKPLTFNELWLLELWIKKYRILASIPDALLDMCKSSIVIAVHLPCDNINMCKNMFMPKRQYMQKEVAYQAQKQTQTKIWRYICIITAPCMMAKWCEVQIPLLTSLNIFQEYAISCGSIVESVPKVLKTD